MKHVYCISFVLLSLVVYSECLGGGRSGAGGMGGMKASKYSSGSARPASAVYNGGSAYSQQYSKENNKTNSKTPPPTKRSSGLTAWGIIAIVLSVILFSVGSYYTFIFYPLLCKKERNYDMIELSNV